IATPCWTCHDFAEDVKKIGPSLLGVFGRRAGWAPNYKPSQALLGASRSGSDESPEGKGKI
ncbi:MAG: hypothetical protein JRF61_02325, partial [Deltaproteobacteria bacterium]|nr:hypothetical protein [Deltaproteobacteria bacterium]